MDTEKQDQAECDSCGFDGIELKPYSMNRNFPQKIEYKTLCEVCASTMIGTAYEYPEQYDYQTLRVIGYCTNLILQEIRNQREIKS